MDARNVVGGADPATTPGAGPSPASDRPGAAPAPGETAASILQVSTDLGISYFYLNQPDKALEAMLRAYLSKEHVEGVETGCPIAALGSEMPRQGTLTAEGISYPIALTPRGITRLKKDICDFPPLRIEFATPPPPTSSPTPPAPW